MVDTRGSSCIWRGSWAFLLGTTLAAGCADDKLQQAPDKVVPVGGIHGCLCDRTCGEWVVGALVTVDDVPNATATSDASGCFELVDVPVGEHDLTVDSPSYKSTRNAFVHADEVIDIGVSGCALDRGSVIGRVCDEAVNDWLSGASVTLPLPAGDLQTTSDDNGRFLFQDVPVGQRQVTVTKDAFTETYDVEVRAYQTSWTGDAACGPVGAIHGRICAGQGYWLSGARVWVELEDGTIIETTTDADGFFTLAAVPGGTVTVQVSRGSFYSSFAVDVAGGTVVELPEPVCIPPTTRMAVVTGAYDSIQDVLVGLGFPIRAYYNSSTTPQIDDSEGNVDIIDGFDDFWVTSFLADPVWMSDYDILFFNCGLDTYAWDAGDAAASQAISNLRAFVTNGKSIYTSDWASDVVRLAFPGQINLYGSDAVAGAACVGVADENVQAVITDAGLQTALGRTDILVNFNLDIWAVLEPTGSQPGSLTQMVSADIDVYVDPETSYDTAPQAKTPILVQFGYGSGRVLFTSFHNESQTTDDMDAILNYMVFEL